MVRVAINGFGRIGRMVLKAALKNSKIKIVAINDLGDSKLLAHLLKYDSVQYNWTKKVSATNNSITIEGKKISFYHEKDPAKLPWKKLKVDVVCESTGFFRTKKLAMKHIEAGAKKVVLSAPAKDEGVKTVVMGVNENTIKKTDIILSNASCTTNSLAPMVSVLEKNFGIVKGFFTTVHAYTVTQNLVDGPSKDWRRARAAAINVIPTTTGAAKALIEVMPKMKGKLDGTALRIPIPSGSITDLTVQLKRKTSIEEVNKSFKNSKIKQIRYSEEALVSTDILGESASVVFDAPLTKVNGNTVKIFGWYDNEWGFSNRMVELISKLK